MKKIITTTIAAGLVAGMAYAEEVVEESSVPATEVSVSADFVSAYVFRGVTLLDGASFQPGIEVSGLGLAEEYGAVTVGAWGSADLDDDNGNANTFQETDWYGSYSLPIDALDVSIGYCEYTYGAGSSDKEASIGLGYDLAGVGLFATYYQGVGGGIGSSMYIEFGAGYDIEASEDLVVSLGARGAYADRSDNSSYWGVAAGESGFADFDLSLGLGYALSDSWGIGASIAYIGQIDDDVLGDDLYDVEAVGTLSLAGSF